jgi:transcriptional regulator with XRE-family HTH domain
MSRDQDPSGKQQTVDELQTELGAALRRERIAQRLEQADVAKRAGVGRAGVSRIENGHGGTIATLLAVVRALSREDWLKTLAPHVAVSPMDLIRRERKTPQRVRRPKPETENT